MEQKNRLYQRWYKWWKHRNRREFSFLEVGMGASGSFHLSLDTWQDECPPVCRKARVHGLSASEIQTLLRARPHFS